MSGEEPTFKAILIGDSGVGKSSLLKTFVGDPFETTYMSTIGMDYEVKPMIVEGQLVNLQIWDTAGQERFRVIANLYFHHTDAVMFVFDLNEISTFRSLDAWYSHVTSRVQSHVQMILVGAKADLDRRQVDYNTAHQWAQAHEMSYIETSAARMYNVEKAFALLATQTYMAAKIAAEKSQNTLTESGSRLGAGLSNSASQLGASNGASGSDRPHDPVGGARQAADASNPSVFLSPAPSQRVIPVDQQESSSKCC